MRIPTSHRPRPVPCRAWAVKMRWHELLFMHWPVPVKMLRPHVPKTLEIETWDGVGVAGRGAGKRPGESPCTARHGDDPVLPRLKELAARHPRYGYRRLHVLLRPACVGGSNR